MSIGVDHYLGNRIVAATGLYSRSISHYALQCNDGSDTCVTALSSNCNNFYTTFRQSYDNGGNPASNTAGGYTVYVVDAQDPSLWGLMCGFCSLRTPLTFAIFIIMGISAIITLVDFAYIRSDIRGVLFFRQVDDFDNTGGYLAMIQNTPGSYIKMYPVRIVSEMYFATHLALDQGFVYNQADVTAFNLAVASTCLSLFEMLLFYAAFRRGYNRISKVNDVKFDPILFFFALVSFSVAVPALVYSFLALKAGGAQASGYAANILKAVGTLVDLKDLIMLRFFCNEKKETASLGECFDSNKVASTA